MHLDRASLPHLAACLLFSGIATPFYAAAADTQTLANVQSGANAGPPRLGGPKMELLIRRKKQSPIRLIIGHTNNLSAPHRPRSHTPRPLAAMWIGSLLPDWKRQS